MASLKTTITNSGLALIEKVVAGSGQLEFVNMAVGDGVNINTSNLVTELVNKRIEVEVSKVYSSDKGTVVCGNVENSTVTESFEIREVGIYAREAGSEDVVLFSYTECEGIGGIPSADIVLINNEMLITIVTGQAEVIYIDNPNATTTRQDVVELTKRVDALVKSLNENYFTKSSIHSGVETQTILGIDPITGKYTNRSIYFSGDTVTVMVDGAIVSFPTKSGTIALLSDVEGAIETNSEAIAEEADARQKMKNELNERIDANSNVISEKVPFLKNATPQPNNNANCFGYRGTLRNLGAFGDVVVVGKLSILTRSSGNQNADTPLWARILKNVDGNWVVASQSKKSRKWNDVSAGTELTWEMESIVGVTPPSADEEIAIVWVNSEEASVESNNGVISFQTISVSGGLQFGLPTVPTTASNLATWCPWISLMFAPMSLGGGSATSNDVPRFGIDTTAATSYTATETYDETSGYTYTCPVSASENGYLSCQITQTHESDATNKIILSCTIDGVVAHKDCAYGYGDMASILIPVATGQVINVEATSSEPATMTAKFMPLKS